MICYIESSVILRRLFGQPSSLKGWGDWEAVFTSEITRVECARAIDRKRMIEPVSDVETADAFQNLEEILARMGEIGLDKSVLRQAARSFPTVLGTLDAIHVASALLWQEQSQKEICFLTHDRQQGVAVRALGMKSLGFEESSR